MNSNPRKNDGDDLELQPPEIVRRPKTGPQPTLRPKSGPAPTLRPKSGPVAHSRAMSGPYGAPPEPELIDPGTLPLSEESPDLLFNDAAPAAGGPPAGPSVPEELPPPTRERVDFENLPEFVWQRKMLKWVRIAAIIVTSIIAIVVILAFCGVFKGAHDTMKDEIKRSENTGDLTPQP